ncbi:MAG: CBS domain-containing protein [Nitrospina sp.]|jgi:CBS domain-containing protein|nr:CBS domain-containing protein [Nitrospina sp.]MBT3874544.1 CBS domain-containing protein [Nitrospina sp.]MBT4049853.1 CBS domain-containing protein [Nitrospina sp.]MBT4557881.1 CBS domain-containing protein [Nitrospina sp.]MBT5349474.1 CBS domain-containing protein [Nitrospina sp.]
MKTARDIMTRNVITVNKDQPISDLSKLFIENHFNGVPVIDDTGKVLGVVTQGDLIEQNKNLHIPTVIALFDAVLFLESEKKFESDVKKLTGSKIDDIYHKNLITVSLDTDLSEITTLMAENDVHTLPVLDGNKLVGIIGKKDVIRSLA